MAISMLKIRRPLGRLVFNMGIAIPGKTVFLIETAPRLLTFAVKPCAFYTDSCKVFFVKHHPTSVQSLGNPKVNFWCYCSETWALWCLKSLATRLFNSFFKLTTRKTLRFRVTVHLWNHRSHKGPVMQTAFWCHDVYLVELYRRHGIGR